VERSSHGEEGNDLKLSLEMGHDTTVVIKYV